MDVVRRVLAELRALLEHGPAGNADATGDDGGDDGGEDGSERRDADHRADEIAARAGLLERLFPPAYPDDPERDAEYQRLMRDELIASRVAAIETVDGFLADGRRLDETELTALMQSVNAVRLVLGTMLGVTEDDADERTDALADAPEWHLYTYLSWLLEWTVQALAGR